MCNLCSKDGIERQTARDMCIYRAEQLERMARHERALASGTAEPHSEESKGISVLARSIIRYLAEEWM